MQSLSGDRSVGGIHLAEPLVDSSEVPQTLQVCDDRVVDHCRQATWANHGAQLGNVSGVECQRHLLLRHSGMTIPPKIALLTPARWRLR